MKKILSLTKVMVKTSFQALSSSKTKKSKKKNALTILGVIALYLYLSVIFFFVSKDLLSAFVDLDQKDLILTLVFVAATLYTLVIAIVTVPTVFYFSKDIETLLAMPLRPIEILIAKSFTTYINLLLGLSFLLIPFGIAYQVTLLPPFYFLIFYLFAALIIPILPLAIAIGLVVILFTFVPKVKNKDLFTYATSILMLAFIFFINFNTISNDNFVNDLITSQTGISQKVSSLLPTVSLLTNGVNKSNIILLLFAAIISLILIYLIIKFVSAIYFKGAIGITESSSKSKKRKVKLYDINDKVSTKTSALMKTDLKNILRTPAFAINYFLPILLLPTFLIFPAIGILKSGELSLDMIKEIMVIGQTIISSIDFKIMLPYVIIASFTFTFFMASLSSITSTSISREGDRMEFYKSLPINMMVIINAKILIGVGLTIITPLIIWTFISFVFKPKLILVIVSLLTIIISAFFSNVFDIIVDVFKPKLVWDDETQAVKQNFLTVIPIFTSFLIIGLIIFVFVFFENSQLLTSIGLLISLFLITVVLYKVVIEKYGLKYLDKAIEKL